MERTMAGARTAPGLLAWICLLLAFSHSECESFAPLDWCRAQFVGRIADFSIISPKGATEWSTASQCGCTFTTMNTTILRMTLGVESPSAHLSEKDNSTCGPLVLVNTGKILYHVCPRSHGNGKWGTSIIHMDKGQTLHLAMVNPGATSYVPHITVKVERGGLEAVCDAVAGKLETSHCPCSLHPIVAANSPFGQDTPIGFIVGITCVLVFAAVFAIVAGLFILYKRRKQAEEEDKMRTENRQMEGAVNPAMVRVEDPNKNKPVPGITLINDNPMYAEIKNPDKGRTMPFDPDPNLNLDLKDDRRGPPNARGAHQGSTDSGMYSMPRDHMPNGYAADSLGPDQMYMSPDRVGYHPPGPDRREEEHKPNLSPEEIEDMYSKPKKFGKNPNQPVSANPRYQNRATPEQPIYPIRKARSQDILSGVDNATYQGDSPHDTSFKSLNNSQRSLSMGHLSLTPSGNQLNLSQSSCVVTDV